LISAENRPLFEAENQKLHEQMVASYEKRQTVTLVPYADARKKRFTCDWSTIDIAEPAFAGSHALEDYPLAELKEYIDWTPFFRTWELKGKYPHIFEDEHVGEEAKRLFDDAQQLLDRIISEKLLRAHGVYGFWPANAIGEDIVVYQDETRSAERCRFHGLRQQWKRKGQDTFFSLADFIAPAESSRRDYVGAFAVTTGVGCDELAARFEAEHDDYNSILAKALADRLAEAFAECLHLRARNDCGYRSVEALSSADLIAEKYRGIRPAPGYPAQPDHTEKQRLFELLEAEKHTGIRLTETYAMHPAASVSGLYFSHPESRYFAVDRITREQVEDYAQRKGMGVAEIERWLRPNLGYEPQPA
jgi:5-methyltetrahydrofolate--homocysteine methyltransferase